MKNTNRNNCTIDDYMKRGIVLLIISAVWMSTDAAAQDSLVAVFWNMENFFDYIDGGGGEADTEFSSTGTRHWSKKRFYAKCDAVAKSIMWMGDRYGRMPDIIGLAEIENRGVLSKMLKSTALRKYDYRIIHYESGDRRGIDVAFLYRESVMEPVEVTLKTPEYDGLKLPTRDILHSRMLLRSGRTLDFIVNHHPSKFGGGSASDGRRNAAMTALKMLCDSLGNASVVAMGDFNDSPDGPAFEIIEESLVNKGKELYMKGEGTIRYEGSWDLIDMFLTGPELDPVTEMEICRMPFHIVRESRHPGEKPFRTYSGPRYIGGISDHFPIVLKIFL